MYIYCKDDVVHIFSTKCTLHVGNVNSKCYRGFFMSEKSTENF